MLDYLRISGRGAVPVWHRVPAFSLSLGWGEGQEEGRRRKQEKGTVSRQVPSDCLHIVFHGDKPRFARDMLDGIGGNPPFPARIREICGHGGSQR